MNCKNWVQMEFFLDSDCQSKIDGLFACASKCSTFNQTIGFDLTCNVIFPVNFSNVVTPAPIPAVVLSPTTSPKVPTALPSKSFGKIPQKQNVVTVSLVISLFWVIVLLFMF